MKINYKFFTLLFALFLFVGQTAFSVNTPVKKTEAETVTGMDFNMTVTDLDAVMDLSAKDIKAFKGKVTVKDRLALGFLKRQIKKQRKAGISDVTIKQNLAAGAGDMDWLAFALGLFLGLIGVLIVYLAMDRGSVRSAWYGVIALVVLALLGFGVGLLGFL